MHKRCFDVLGKITWLPRVTHWQASNEIVLSARHATTMGTARWINSDIVRINRCGRARPYVLQTARCISPAPDSAWVIGNYRHCHRVPANTPWRKLSVQHERSAHAIIHMSILVWLFIIGPVYRLHALTHIHTHRLVPSTRFRINITYTQYLRPYKNSRCSDVDLLRPPTANNLSD